MKVLLKEDVDNLGYAGEIMKVADGYGRNYLIPKGLAVMATAGVLKQASVWRDRAAVRMAELQKEHQALAARIDKTQLEFTARAGETGKLYGSITSSDIADQLNETLGTEIDKRSVASGPLRSLGEHQVPIRLSRDFSPRVKVMVIPFSEEPEADEAPEAELEAAVNGELEAGAVSEVEQELEVAGELEVEEELAGDEGEDPAAEAATEEDEVVEVPDAEEPATETDTTSEDEA
jgi:large subunit ribosomal protein L9